MWPPKKSSIVALETLGEWGVELILYCTEKLLWEWRYISRVVLKLHLLPRWHGVCPFTLRVGCCICVVVLSSTFLLIIITSHIITSHVITSQCPWQLRKIVAWLCVFVASYFLVKIKSISFLMVMHKNSCLITHT